MALAHVALGRDAGERVGFLRLDADDRVSNKGRDEGSCGRRTLRYSLEASCHSLVMVCGGGLAKNRMVPKATKLTTTATMVPTKTLPLSPGGSRARGPWGPKAIQYAVEKN